MRSAEKAIALMTANRYKSVEAVSNVGCCGGVKWPPSLPAADGAEGSDCDYLPAIRKWGDDVNTLVLNIYRFGDC